MGTDHLSAAFIAIGFEMRLYSRTDVGAWVDAEVERLDVLPNALLELTLLRDKHDVDIAKLLRALAREPMTADEWARIGMGVLHDLVSAGRVTIPRAVYWASTIASDLSWDEYGEATELEERYDHAKFRSYGTVAEAERAFREFLHRYART